jgi:hypothetical protein
VVRRVGGGHHRVSRCAGYKLDALEWSASLRRVAEDAKLRAQLKAGVRPPPTSQEVAPERVNDIETPGVISLASKRV